MSCALNSLVDGGHQSLSVDFYSKNRQAYEALSYARDKTDRFQSGAVIPIQRFGEFLSEEGDLSKLNERLTRFNLFAALGAAEHEARHSDFLAWLLNPSNSWLWSWVPSRVSCAIEKGSPQAQQIHSRFRCFQIPES